MKKYNTRHYGANLRNENLYGANLSGPVFTEKANLSGPVFSEVIDNNKTKYHLKKRANKMDKQKFLKIMILIGLASINIAMGFINVSNGESIAVQFVLISILIYVALAVSFDMI
jgi:uncharacterized protein YjbI with pentapeptide repeats